MAGKTSVEYEAMKQLEMNLRSMCANVEQHLQKAKSEVAQVAGASWTGQSASKYSELQTQWHTSATQLLQSARALADFLGTASTAFSDTDSQLTRGLSQM